MAKNGNFLTPPGGSNPPGPSDLAVRTRRTRGDPPKMRFFGSRGQKNTIFWHFLAFFGIFWHFFRFFGGRKIWSKNCPKFGIKWTIGKNTFLGSNFLTKKCLFLQKIGPIADDIFAIFANIFECHDLNPTKLCESETHKALCRAQTIQRSIGDLGEPGGPPGETPLV